MKERPPTRYARIIGEDIRKFRKEATFQTPVAVVRGYLPSNYKAHETKDGTGDIYISGIDNAGWSMDDYVIPRLGSGLINAVEISFEEVQEKIPIHMW